MRKRACKQLGFFSVWFCSPFKVFFFLLGMRREVFHLAPPPVAAIWVWFCLLWKPFWGGIHCPVSKLQKCLQPQKSLGTPVLAIMSNLKLRKVCNSSVKSGFSLINWIYLWAVFRMQKPATRFFKIDYAGLLVACSVYLMQLYSEMGEALF